MDKKRVLILVPCEQDVRDEWQRRFGENGSFIFAEAKENVSEEQLREAEIIIGEPDEDALFMAENLRWLQLTWAGADKYTNMSGFPAGVTLTSASGAFGTIISEYVTGSLVALSRGFPAYWRNQQKHVWRPYRTDDSIFGKTALILGTGDIGSNVARRLKAFGARTLGMRRSENAAPLPDFDGVYGLDRLDELLPEADLLIGCLPAAPETKGLLNAARFERMKPGALLVNAGRGSLIVQADLERALSSGHLGGAALDVFETEPLPQDSPLWDMDNVLITPHIAGPSFGGNRDVRDRIWEICMDNMERWLKGEGLRNIVIDGNPDH